MEAGTKKSGTEWTAARRVVVGFAGVITLIALFYAEEDLRGQLAWHSYQREAEAKGVVLDRHAFEPAPVPDDENFAMTPFFAPLLDYTAEPVPHAPSIWRDQAGHERATNFAANLSDLGDNFKNSAPNTQSPWIDIVGAAKELQRKSKTMAQGEISSPTVAAQALLNEFQQYDPVMDELRTASKRPGSRFDVHYDETDPPRILLPHLAVLRRVGHILFYRGAAELVLGQNDAAYEDAGMLIKMADSIHTEPFMISQLVRMAMLNQAGQLVWEGLATRAWSAAQLQDLQGRLEKLDVLADAQRAIKWEHAEHGSAIFDVARTKPELLAEDAGWGSGTTRLIRWMPSGWSYLEQVSYNRIFDQVVSDEVNDAGTRIPAHEIEANMKRLQQLVHISPWAAFVHHRIAAAMLIPAETPYFQRTGFCATMMNEAAIACALERYRVAHGGQFPGTLDALSPDFMKEVPKDVITGEPLKYSPGDREFVLYSVGWNETDDGGQGEFQGGKRRDLAKGDWVWPEYQAK